MRDAITITMPERVWDDFLNPLASEMQGELGLDEPGYRRRGKGAQRVYHDVSNEIALDLARYLWDRGETLLAQGVDDPYDPMEKAMRDTYRAAMKVAERIRGNVETARRIQAAIDAPVRRGA